MRKYRIDYNYTEFGFEEIEAESEGEAEGKMRERTGAAFHGLEINGIEDLGEIPNDNQMEFSTELNKEG